MAEPANRKERPDGGKYYLHPLTDEAFDSVTTILDDWDKAGLKIWAGQLAAAFAMDHAPQLIGAAIVPDCGNTFNRCYEKHGREARCERCPCGECERCWQRRVAWRHAEESGRRAQEGTECHEAIDHWVLMAGDRLTLRQEVQPYFDQFLRWVADYGLAPDSWVHTEATLINRQYMYAGTSDAAVWIRRGTAAANTLLDRIGHPHPLAEALVRVDYKTREKTDERLYNDVPLQGVAYENCDTVLLPDGKEAPAPKTDARMLLQLRPDDYSFVPMVSGAPEFQAFLALLTAYRWRQLRGGKVAFDPAVVFERITPDAVFVCGPASQPPPQPPRKAAKKAAAPKQPPTSPVTRADPFEVARTDTATIKIETVDALDDPFADRKGRQPFPAGAPVKSALDDEIPF